LEAPASSDNLARQEPREQYVTRQEPRNKDIVRSLVKLAETDFQMRWLLNSVYLALLTVLSPVIAWRMVRHGRYRRGLAEKLFGRIPKRLTREVVWFHAVSVGEVIQLQKIVDEFLRLADNRFDVLISTSTDTGFDLAVKRFPDCQVTWFPLDFSWAVRNALRTIRPRMVVLMELELWPNFLAECQRGDISVAVINARMSTRSHRGYLRIRRLMAPLFSRLTFVAAQSQSSADRLQSLGVPADRLHVTGSIKFDGVSTDRNNPATALLRRQFGITPTEVVFIAGSTQAPEEQLALQTWLECRRKCPSLRLILVPRHRERFDEVAQLVQAAGAGLMRKSSLVDSAELTGSASADSVILVDTIGDLSACWGLADIAFVGGSFGKRGGQNMIEPAAFGAAVLFGPNTRNFRDVVQSFREADACLQLQSEDELTPTIARLLSDSVRRKELGDAAQRVVESQAGATKHTAALLMQALASGHFC
ncbi:MAG TPA: 3-deoxy-D-manno-octulosonic acid transferase, partial [Planctomycetaceae bacterium]|nr:3-deoxy-D-manno-octulosonic acid transferase [Planctomycetaceae bacterium]